MSLRVANLFFAFLICCFVFATMYISSTIVDRQEALRGVSRYNTSWLASQAVAEFTRLEHRLVAYATQRGGVDKEEVQLRFDVLLNRMSLFKNGEFQEFVNSDPERAKIAQELDEAVAAAEPSIQRLDEPGSAERALALLTPIEGGFARLASAANRFGADRVAEDQHELLRLHWLFSGLAAGLVLCGFLLIVILFWQNRALDRARSGLGDLARDLEGKSTLLEATLDTIDEGLLVFDDFGKIQVFNRRAVELLDIPNDLWQTATVQMLDQRQLERGAIWQKVSEQHTNPPFSPMVQSGS